MFASSSCYGWYCSVLYLLSRAAAILQLSIEAAIRGRALNLRELATLVISGQFAETYTIGKADELELGRWVRVEYAKQLCFTVTEFWANWSSHLPVTQDVLR